jgi:hypothetical protein
MFMESDGGAAVAVHAFSAGACARAALVFLVLLDDQIIMMTRRTRTVCVRSVPCCFSTAGGWLRWWGRRSNSHQKGHHKSTTSFLRFCQRSLNSTHS